MQLRGRIAACPLPRVWEGRGRVARLAWGCGGRGFSGVKPRVGTVCVGSLVSGGEKERHIDVWNDGNDTMPAGVLGALPSLGDGNP